MRCDQDVWNVALQAQELCCHLHVDDVLGARPAVETVDVPLLLHEKGHQLLEELLQEDAHMSDDRDEQLRTGCACGGVRARGSVHARTQA